MFVSPLRGCGVKSDDTTCGGCSYAHLSSSILHGWWKGILLSVKGTIESYTQPQENVSAKKSMMYCTDFTDSVVTLVTAIPFHVLSIIRQVLPVHGSYVHFDLLIAFR